MSNIYRDLSDEAFFTDYVGRYYEGLPKGLADLVAFDVEIDHALIQYAYEVYTGGVKKFSLILQSGDPDHYKRSGCLLYALYLTEPIRTFALKEDLDGRDTLCTELGVTHADAERELGFARLYETYHNEMTAFDLAVGICSQYEATPPHIDLDYAWTVCAYLRNNPNLSVESLFMLFRSLFQR